MKVRDILKRLRKDGWRLDRTRGDHRQFVHDGRPDSDTVTVAGHPKDELAPGTLS
jgi:predicted RNA binding protein YcfA (HicA-like mRNA interferase family)